MEEMFACRSLMGDAVGSNQDKNRNWLLSKGKNKLLSFH